MEHDDRQLLVKCSKKRDAAPILISRDGQHCTLHFDPRKSGQVILAIVYSFFWGKELLAKWLLNDVLEQFKPQKSSNINWRTIGDWYFDQRLMQSKAIVKLYSTSLVWQEIGQSQDSCGDVFLFKQGHMEQLNSYGFCSCYWIHKDFTPSILYLWSIIILIYNWYYILIKISFTFQIIVKFKSRFIR